MGWVLIDPKKYGSALASLQHIHDLMSKASTGVLGCLCIVACTMLAPAIIPKPAKS
jgi:hypothetical protein